MISDRQMEIVILVGRDGASWARVSRVLECHPSTVRSHVKRIKDRLEIHRKPREAMVIAYYKCIGDA
jgi:DNA-binding CsgD family transcriptional regulator